MQATKNPSQIIGVRCRIGDESWREQENAIENQRESEGELERARESGHILMFFFEIVAPGSQKRTVV